MARAGGGVAVRAAAHQHGVADAPGIHDDDDRAPIRARLRANRQPMGWETDY